MSKAQGKTGILLVNLGTPDSPEPAAVGRYLTEFLLDPYVIRMPGWLRWLLVKILIVPRRKHASSELYKNIWLPEGSPLLVFSQRLAAKMQKRLGEKYVIELAMRYGSPSLEQGIARLQKAGVNELRIVPLYPQYALSSTETCLDACLQVAKKLKITIPISFYKEFCASPSYLDVLTQTVREVADRHRPDYLLFSFHGLPESHIRLTDPGEHCFSSADCCERFQDKAPRCYRAQSYFTARYVRKNLQWPEDKSLVCFQSRLGREPWLRPFTDQVVIELAQKGVKKLAVACPAFTADCLETLEEIAIRAQKDFREHGGEEIILIPSLNDRDDWVDALAEIIEGEPRFSLEGREIPLYQ